MKRTTRKQIKEQAARYFKFVEWSQEDNTFIGQCPALFIGGVHGPDEAAVFKELCETVEEWIELLNTDGKPLPDAGNKKHYSGKFVVRINPAVHRRIAAKAQAEGESLNSYIEHRLVNS